MREAPTSKLPGRPATPLAGQPPARSRLAILRQLWTSHALVRLIVLVCAYAALAIIFTWPLAAHLGDGVFSPIDPIDSIWRIGQAHDRLLHDPARLFDANVLYPYPRSYLFDELIVGAALLTLPLRLFTQNPIAIYNLGVLATFVLSGLAMYALARHLRCPRLAAFVAGLIYAFAPLRFTQFDHIGLLSAQYFPLIILCLDRLFAAPRWRYAFALAALLALQALSSQYYALYLVFVVGGFVALRLVQLGWRRFPGSALWMRLLVAGFLAVLPVLPFALAYRAVQAEHAFARPIDENTRYSASLASFVTAGPRNALWGDPTAPLREIGAYSPERDLFLGLAALLLALVGALTAWRRPLPQYLLLLGAGSVILACGPILYASNDPASVLFTHLPYGYLYRYLPGFDAMRAPARLGIFYGLSVAALAALGLRWLLARLALWQRRRADTATPVARRWRAALAILAIAAICAESANRPYPVSTLESGAAIPPVYQWLAAQPDAEVVIHLPLIAKRDRNNNRYQYFSLYHRARVVNGSSDILPTGYLSLAEEIHRGPTNRSLRAMQGLGVNYIVVHYGNLTDRLAARHRQFFKAETELAVEVASFGDDVIYRLEPTDEFNRLRALIPPDASVYLAQDEAQETYIGMLGWVLRENRLYARVPTAFGQRIVGPPLPGEPCDYAVLHRKDNPAAVGFAGATVIWEDETARVYRRTTP